MSNKYQPGSERPIPWAIYIPEQADNWQTDMQTRSSWICLLHACMLYPGLKYIHILQPQDLSSLCVCPVPAGHGGVPAGRGGAEQGGPG